MLHFLLHLFGVVLSIVTAAGLLARFIPPDAVWPPAVIALLLPGLLLGTFLYAAIVIWWKQWANLIIPGLVLLFAVPLVPQLFAFNFSHHSATNSPSVHVVTTNLRNFRNDDLEQTEPQQALQFLRDAEPDILLFQEFITGKQGTAYQEALKKQTGLNMRHQPERSTVSTHGAKIKIIGDYFEKGPYNGVLVTDVETELGTIRVINVHLQSNRITKLADEIGENANLEQEVNRAGSMFRSYGAAAATRADQAETIRKLVRESPHPVVLGGDFNDVSSSYTYRRSLTPRLKDAWVEAGSGLGTTFTGPLPGLRIDFLMVDTALTVRFIERLETGYSDHRGLHAVISR